MYAQIDTDFWFAAPRANVVGNTANVSFSVILNIGQTYSARDIDGLASTSLASSIVASNKPIAVTVHEGGLTNNGCLRTLGDQITSADFAETDFIMRKSTATNESVYILATQNGTNLTTTNSATTNALISWSETYEYVLTEGVNYIKTNKPVYVLQETDLVCQWLKFLTYCELEHTILHLHDQHQIHWELSYTHELVLKTNLY